MVVLLLTHFKASLSRFVCKLLLCNQPKSHSGGAAKMNIPSFSNWDVFFSKRNLLIEPAVFSAADEASHFCCKPKKTSHLLWSVKADIKPEFLHWLLKLFLSSLQGATCNNYTEYIIKNWLYLEGPIGSYKLLKRSRLNSIKFKSSFFQKR